MPLLFFILMHLHPNYVMCISIHLIRQVLIQQITKT
uniref:Uncharacterized protein n=1 Tax=Picea glauca TaxID=3330 RepID=A0A117NI85_PICGL|nr:hypothetical protein ABT39_MTgene2803 [Picea glauca]